MKQDVKFRNDLLCSSIRFHVSNSSLQNEMKKSKYNYIFNVVRKQNCEFVCFLFFRQMHLILAMPFDVSDRPFGRCNNTTKYKVYLHTIFAKNFCTKIVAVSG